MPSSVPSCSAAASPPRAPTTPRGSTVHGIEPQYQAIRTIDIERGRAFRFTDEEQSLRVAIIGADATAQLFGTRDSIGQTVSLNGIPVHGHRQDPQEGSGQQLQRAGQRQGVHSVLVDGAGLSRVPTSHAGVVSNLIVAPQPWVLDGLPQVLDNRTGRIEDIDWPLDAKSAACWLRGTGSTLTTGTPSRCGTPRSRR